MKAIEQYFFGLFGLFFIFCNEEMSQNLYLSFLIFVG